MQDYYFKFGIPIISPYARSVRNGKFKSHRTSYILTFESILYSLISYANTRNALTSKRKLKTIERNYQEVWNKLESCDITIIKENIQL